MKEHNVLSIVLRDNLHQPQVSVGIHMLGWWYNKCYIDVDVYLVCGETGEDIEILY